MYSTASVLSYELYGHPIPPSFGPSFDVYVKFDKSTSAYADEFCARVLNHNNKPKLQNDEAVH